MRWLKHLAVFVSLPLLAQQNPTGIYATAQCEGINTNVLGITSLQECDIGITNYSAGTVIVSQAMIRQWFPTLDIEDPGRAQAVADKAFNSSKKAKAIAAFNFISPLMVGVMGSGLINFSVSTALKAVTATSLANSGLQAFKSYLLGLEPNESAFLPNLPNEITLTPYGTSGFSGVWTVLGSITYTNPVAGARKRAGLKRPTGPPLIWNGNLPPVPVPHAGIPQENANLIWVRDMLRGVN